jgi:predicted nucleic acid-binding protein
LTFFVDANVLIYGAVDGPYRESCVAILSSIAAGEAQGRTSTAVLEEVWHVERSRRAGEIGGLAERAYSLMTPLLAVTDEAFRLALSVEAPGLGANDLLHVGTCMAHGIDVIVTADKGFGTAPGLRRIDPLDAGARLLARS